MGVDVFLLIICIVFTALSLLVGLYFVFTFQHPEDKKTGWFSKIIITLALGVSTMNVLMLPLDAINRSSGSTLHIDIMCWVFTIISIVLAFVVIPFTIMLFEGQEDDQCKHPLLRAFLLIIPFLAFLLILFLILWFAVGRCEVPITIHKGALDSGSGACAECCMYHFYYKCFMNFLNDMTK
ncbi:hypothetical protein TRFO_39802 [Tritrichomonas foetus]|uniref:Uncharacterized protein n=1 Tax=Tritrichomonas foetus TaxID=1144522 RepID=A0A1J4J5U6_9EUKA|nr:hypothetical protein TRFO_39802 [Tritrichomonas foetus]|eukprot:OHS94033.1 hypothetical protein TRFO_39802 [Tritrichomonas foetus]